MKKTTKKVTKKVSKMASVTKPKLGSSEPVKNYTASIKIMGVTYSAEGKTIRQAIEGLKPKNAKSSAILYISNGEITKERIIGMPIVMRLFSFSKLMREIALKNVSLLFDL